MAKIEAHYVDHMGNDDSVVNAARISMDKQAHHYTDSQNAHLIKFLATGQSSKDRKRNIEYMASGEMSYEEAEALVDEYMHMAKHWTPFAHTAITLRVSAPVPIRTQCFKHKQGLVENEESRRYITCRPEVFIPNYFRNKAESIKQGSVGVHPESDHWLGIYEAETNRAVNIYEAMIACGVAPEQARLILPQGCIVNWIWTGNVFAFAAFCSKRKDPTAQKEVSDLADIVSNIIEPLFPVSWSALSR